MRIWSRAVTRAVIVLFLLSYLLVFSLFFETSAGDEIIFDHNEIWGDGTYNMVNKMNTVAQSFKASSHYTPTKISLHVKSDKDTELNVTIQTSVFGVPSGTEIGYFMAVSSPPIVSNDWMDFYASSQIDIQENTTYWMVAKSSEAPPNGYFWYTSDMDAYPAGMMAQGNIENGDPWSLNTADDQMFRIWGEPLSSTLYFDLLVDREVAEPGETLEYTIFFNNTGNAKSAKVWINDSLPSGLDYLSDTASDLPSFSGRYREGALLHYNFTNVTPGSHYFSLRVAVNESFPVGLEVTNWAYMDYTDSNGLYVSSLGDGVTSRIEFHEPSIVVRAVVSKENVESKDIITYTIYFNNSGTGTASHVWINDTIAESVEFLTSNPPPVWNDSREYRFIFSDVSPGNYSLSLAVMIGQGLPEETIFLNSVVLNYTNSRDNPKPGSYDSTISVLMSGSSTETDWLMSPSLLASIVLVIGSVSAGATFVIMKRKRPTIDEIFFLYRSGELIKHYTRRIKPDVDSDILSGMLVAVQDFVGDSFRFRRGELNRLNFGNYQILIIQCQHVILAAVTTGPEPRRLDSQLRDVCKEVERKFGDKLEKWSGLPEELEGADEIIQRLIVDKY